MSIEESFKERVDRQSKELRECKTDIYAVARRYYPTLHVNVIDETPNDMDGVALKVIIS